MIRLFNETTKTFDNNGILILQPLSAVVHEEENGNYYLDLILPLKKEYINNAIVGAIVVAPTPNGEQAFRIYSITQNLNQFELKCLHVFYDTYNYLILDNYVEKEDCNYAIQYLNSNTQPESTFTTWADVPTVASFRCVRNSLFEAIQTIIEKWGGHLVRNNFDIGIANNIEVFNGVYITYQNNLKEMTCTEDWSKVVTKLLPVGKDGILLNAVNPDASIYVTSTQQYDIPYCKTVSFEQDIDRKDYSSDTAYKRALVSNLLAQAEKYIEKYCVPQANYTLSAKLNRKVVIGEKIIVVDNRYNLKLETHVISYDYNCLLGDYNSIQFGYFKPELNNLISNIRGDINTAFNQAQQQAREIEQQLTSGNIYNGGNELLVVDTLPKETATNIIKFDKFGMSYSNTGINGTYNLMYGLDGVDYTQSVVALTGYAETTATNEIAFSNTNATGNKLSVYEYNSKHLGSEVISAEKVEVSGALYFTASTSGNITIMIVVGSTEISCNVNNTTGIAVIPPTMVNAVATNIIKMIVTGAVDSISNALLTARVIK